MSATHIGDSTSTAVPTLDLAFDLGWTAWSLASTNPMAHKPRLKTIAARDLDALQQEIARAKACFGLPDDPPVVSCHMAGRDGFWLDRWLRSQGVVNRVVDAASIEVDRRARRAKSDGLDVGKLLTKHSHRIKGWLAGLGLEITVDATLVERLEAPRQWDGRPVPEAIHQRILREFERWMLVGRQVRDLDNAQRRAIRDDATVDVDKVRRLLDLKAIGPVSATRFVREFFGWRRIKNRREPARARHQQGGQPRAARDDRGDRLDVAARPATIGVELLA